MANKKTAKKKTTKKSPLKSAKRKAPAKKKLTNIDHNINHNVVVWFEIPVTNIHRAAKFYSTVFGIKLNVSEMGDAKGAMFPVTRGAASGALVQSNENKPSRDGTMIYLNGGKDLSKPLSLVEKAGGKVIQEKMEIGEYGFIAIFEDSEGNQVALQSMS
ncbi:MAG: VOC family protein [Bdellovibrionia bacterium]